MNTSTMLRASAGMPNFAVMQTFLTARWQHLIMANYPVDPLLLQPFLPAGTRLDLHNGAAWISLVGFLFRRTRLFGVPIPWLGNFEEVNLRFYVLRDEPGETRRGVVFLNETVPFRLVAQVANALYNEHYTALPMRHNVTAAPATLDVRYEWKVKHRWNRLGVCAAPVAAPQLPGSFESFIFEHYYGYTRLSSQLSEEYKVNHPSWLIHQVQSYEVDCDFERMYGAAFGHLSAQAPHSVFLAAGSPVSVDWKRRRFAAG